MRLSNKRRLYILADSETLDNIYYVQNGVVKKQPFAAFNHTTNSPFLKHNPNRWKDEELDWLTADDYMLNRSFNLALEFVYDGARIIRSRQYFGKGTEEVMYLAILKWNRADDVYYLEYKGKIDLSSTDDALSRTVTINSVEGGILSYFNANKSTTYEIPCDQSNESIKLVLIDGMNLNETLNYSFLDVDIDGEFNIVPVAFLNNEGDHEGVLYGSPIYESMLATDYFKTSENYIVKNFSSNNIIFHFKGTLNITKIDTNDNSGTYHLYGVISSNTVTKPNFDIVTHAIPCDSFSADLEFDVTLAPGEKFFMYNFDFFTAPGIVGGTISYAKSDFKISFISRKDQTSAFCLTLYDYYKQLVLKLTNSLYVGESLYLKSRPDLVVTCGDALRNSDQTIVTQYVIASSFDDMFKSIPGSKELKSSVGLQIRGNVLYLELLSDLYNEGVEIFDLGEVSKMRIRPDQVGICNTITNGYPDQTYESNGGKYEVNSEQEWQLPVISNKQAFDIRSVWRADPRGIEEIRNNFTHLDTTDNAGDKQPFILNVDPEGLTQSFTASRTADKDYTGQSWLDYDTTSASFGATMQLNANGYEVDFTGTFNRANIDFFVTINNNGNNVQVLLFKNGQSLVYVITNDTDGVTPIHLSVPNVAFKLNDNIEVRIIPLEPTAQDFTVKGANMYFEFLTKPLTLFRDTYDSISGVLDATLYNVNLRPRNQIYWHGNELAAKLNQLKDQQITLNTATKNTTLSTTKGGVTETENAPINVPELGNPLHLGYDAYITTVTPYNFSDLLAMSTAGYFTWTREGYRFYGLPWGSLKSKPATEEAQEWQLRLSPKNIFSDFYNSSYNDFISLNLNNDNMVAVHTNSPLHWIKYNYTPQAKYHHKDMHEDWSWKRFENWVHVPFYVQKWQTSDNIVQPAIVTGLGALTMFVYDKKGDLYDTVAFNVVNTPYVKLPYILQLCTIPLNDYDEGYYLLVIKSGATPIWISEWCQVKVNFDHTFLIQYSHSENEKNMPWKAIDTMELRVDAEFGQWEPDSEATEYEDDTGDFSITRGQGLQKRALLIGHHRKEPEWMGLKINSILLKDRVFIEGDTSDDTKHYTRREGTQIEVTRYAGMPYLGYSIDVIPANNPDVLIAENLPINEENGWHATIDAQVFGLDTGTTDITIENE